MLITLRIPKAAADKLNLGSATTDEELTVTLTAVELAGRLTLATGKVIGPEAVVRYCSAWKAATAASSALAEKHGPHQLAETLRKGCRECSLWVPDLEEDVLLWLHHVLLAHFLSSDPLETDPPGAIPDWASLQTAGSLAELCEVNFPRAYHLWIESEATSPATEEPRPE